jgi:hypothetical protein
MEHIQAPKKYNYIKTIKSQIYNDYTNDMILTKFNKNKVVADLREMDPVRDP